MTTITAPTSKQLAHALIDALPDNATWTELAYRLEVRDDIEEGLTDVGAGRVVSTAELRRKFGQNSLREGIATKNLSVFGHRVCVHLSNRR